MDLEHGRRRSILNDVRLCEQLAQNYGWISGGYKTFSEGALWPCDRIPVAQPRTIVLMSEGNS